MTDDYAGYNTLGAQDGVEGLGCGPMHAVSLLKRKKCNYRVEADQQAIRHRDRLQRE